MTLLFAISVAAGQSLVADMEAAIGADRAPFEGIATRADVTGPSGSFATLSVSLSDGTSRFDQARSSGHLELLVVGDAVLQRLQTEGPLEPAPAAMRAFVRGHDVHRVLLDLSTRFVEGRSRGRCAHVTSEDGPSGRVCRDREGRPAELIYDVDSALGGGTVRLELSEWREVLGVTLPFQVDFVQGRDRFVYRYSEVLPFRVAPGASLPDDPTALHARLGDLAAVAAVHHRAMEAHRANDIELLVADQAPHGIQSGRGQLTSASPDKTRARLGPYLQASRFEHYADRVPPVIAVSADGTLAWLACEMEARGTQLHDGGSTPLAFGFSWVELLALQDKRWVRIGNASNRRPAGD